MSLPSSIWHVWDRVKLRTLTPSQYSMFRERWDRLLLCEFSATVRSFIHRLVLLMWIDETRLAERLWKEEWENKIILTPYDMRNIQNLEDLLFRLLICEKEFGGGYHHPEFRGPVEYYVLKEEEAFKLSTAPLSELLKMDKPSISSADGLINIGFDKHELERVAEMVPERHHGELRLPLILLKASIDYTGTYKAVGSKLENFLIQKLLKLTNIPFERYTEAEGIKVIESISMLKRRKFNTIYKVLPEREPLWLSITYDNPSFPEP